MTTKHKAAAAAALLLLGGGYLLWRHKTAKHPGVAATPHVHPWWDLLDPYPDTDANHEGCIRVDSVTNTTTGDATSGEGHWYCGDKDPRTSLPGGW